MNYWQLLTAAEQDLADGALRLAETGYHAALAARDDDGRRVFFTEQVPDGLGRLWRRFRGQPPREQSGRWDARLAAFRRDYEQAARETTAQARTILDLGPGDDPQQAVRSLEEALFLGVDSRLVSGELAATSLLSALLELAPLVRRLPDLALVPDHDSLTATTRLELAQLALQHLADVPADQRRPWTVRFLSLLDGEPPHPWPPEAEGARRWLAAGLADRDLDDCGELVRRWEACDIAEQLPARCHWSRLRRLELLAGCDPRRPRRPDAQAARRLAVGLPRDGGDDLAVRLQAALDTIDYRAPRADLDSRWLSGAVDDQGEVRLISWWGDCPRDVLSWHPDEDPADLRQHLRKVGDRVVWSGRQVPAVLQQAWGDQAPGQCVVPLLETLLEPQLPLAGWSDDLSRGLALARSGPWRQDWRPDLGLPVLTPPGADGRLGDGQQPHAPAIEAGLLWLALVHRLDTGDPALRAGLQELGRRGHATARFVHDLAVLGAPDKATVDAGFQPWTLPLLWTRPDPLTGQADDAVGTVQRPELAGQDVAVVVGGAPAAVMQAWGDGEQRWRVVMDQPGRQEHLTRLARESYGPVTVVPRRGRVHQLGAALARLSDLIDHDTAHQDLLALCHWVRLVETHNGDLLDFQALRPRDAAACPLYQRYADAVADLATEAPRPDGDGWGAQYAQRVRRSGLVAGLVDDLPDAGAELDPLWGVFDGSEASWVFLDSAAVHWRLGQGDPGTGLHGLLATRGRRHLSLLCGAGILPDDLRAHLDAILAAYGKPYHADLADDRAPRLRVAGAFPLPGAFLNPAGHRVAVLAHLEGADQETAVLRPADELDARFWSEVAAGLLGPVGWRLSSALSVPGTRRLVVPRLVSLDGPGVAAARGDEESDWQQADHDRRRRREAQRRRMALEMAALQAAGPGLVEILDARWWRWFQPATVPEPSPGVRYELLHADAATTPGTEQVRDWLADGGCVAGQVPGWSGGPLAAASSLALAGRHLHVGDGGSLWTELAATILGAWERGQEASRMLVVADRPPAGMAALVAALGAAGRSVLTDHEPGAIAPGPLVWARPDRLVEAIASGHEPGSLDAVLLLDLDRLLPRGQGQPLAGAGILGWLGRGHAGRVDLVGGPLAPAWVAFLGRQLGGEVETPATGPGGWTVLRRGGVPRAEAMCPVCGNRQATRADGLACAGCGLGLARASLPGDPVDGAAARGRSLLAQTDLGRDHPLEIWGEADALAAVRREALAAGAEPDTGDLLSLTLPDRRRWLLRTLEPGCRAEAPVAVLLQPPADPGDLRPLAPRGRDSELQLLYDEADLQRLGTGAAGAATERFLAVLGDAEALASVTPGHDQPGRPTVTTWALAWLAGLSEPSVRSQLADLRWAARLGEAEAPVAPPTASKGRLRLHVSQRDLESQLGGLSTHMRAVVGAGHGALPLGVSAALPWPEARDSAGLVQRQLDRFLALAADPTWCARLGQAPSLVHVAPRGSWFALERQAGRLVDADQLVGRLAEILDLMATWCGALLAEVSRVETGLEVSLALPLEPRDQALLVLGQELGFWSLGGELGPELVSLADITDRFAPAVAEEQSPCRTLLVEQAAAAEQWVRRLSATPAGGVLVSLDDQEAVAESRRWWQRGGADPLDDLRTEVAGLARRPGPSSLVLDGPPGTGKLDALLSGLVRSQPGRRAEIWCPDPETLAHVQLAARQLDRRWSPDLRLVTPDQDPAAVLGRAPAEVRPVVLLQVQRLPRAVSYKLQDAGRDLGLIMTVDPWEIPLDTSWEDLFVTTPREADVRRLRIQRVQARHPWEICRALLPAAGEDARPRRKDRGHLEARQAGTIDECAAAITSAHAAERLGGEVLVLAPHAEDVNLLGRALADRRWSSSRLDEVAPLLAPGLLETVAALADAHRQRHGQWPGGVGELAPSDSLLGMLLPDGDARTWPRWLRSLPENELDDAATFLSRWQRSPWSSRVRPGPDGRERIHHWTTAGGVSPAACLPPAVWCAWRRLMARACRRPDLEPQGPVALLSTVDAPPSLPAESLVYVCFGNEPPGVHRRALSRVSDRGLVLYQERSPLPGEDHHA